MGIDPVTHKPKNDALLPVDGQSKNAANLSHMAQWESARLEAEARLARQSKLRSNAAGSSNSFQQAQSSEFASTSSQLPKAIAPPRCLDVLKAWNGDVWSKTNEPIGSVPAGGIVGDVESPTSTLSSSAGFVEFVGNSCDGGIMVEYGDNPTRLPLHETPSFPLDWGPEESMRGGGHTEHVPTGNFVEKFTDLLLSTSAGGDHRRFAEDGGESDNGGGSDYFEDNKNYWNSILNLVNSSPSDSPMF